MSRAVLKYVPQSRRQGVYPQSSAGDIHIHTVYNFGDSHVLCPLCNTLLIQRDKSISNMQSNIVLAIFERSFSFSFLRTQNKHNINI